MTQLKCKQVTVRKARACDWCGRRIKTGDSAQYRVGVWEGDFSTSYLHPECWTAVLQSGDDISDGYYPFEQLRGKTFEDSHA